MGDAGVAGGGGEMAAVRPDGDLVLLTAGVAGLLGLLGLACPDATAEDIGLSKRPGLTGEVLDRDAFGSGFLAVTDPATVLELLQHDSDW